jgi:hypothetical protein
MIVRTAFHRQTGRRIVEVLDNHGKFVAAIYPRNEDNGILITSFHIRDVIDDKCPTIPAVMIRFNEQ